MASSVDLILRTEKTAENKFGIEYVDTIAPDEVCVVCLGGNSSVTAKDANGYASVVDHEIVEFLSEPVSVYSVIYNFSQDDASGDKDRGFDLLRGRGHMINRVFQDMEDFILIQDNNASINYNFETFILPMLNEDGEKVPTDFIPINLYMSIHIDGDAKMVMKKLLKKVRHTMHEMGYDKEDIITAVETLKAEVVEDNTQYIDDLFNRVLLPRISDTSGKRLPFDIVLHRIRKISFAIHCHGGFVYQKLENLAESKMHELGYSNDEINRALSQMLAVAHSPSCRYGANKSRFLGFASAADSFVDTPKNWVTEYIRTKRNATDLAMKQKGVAKKPNDWIKFCFLEGRLGQLFLVPNIFNQNENDLEHNYTGFVEHENQSQNGKMMSRIAGNILINGIENSLAQNDKEFIPLPETRELMGPDSEQYETLCKNGCDLMNDVRNFAVNKIAQILSRNK